MASLDSSVEITHTSILLRELIDFFSECDFYTFDNLAKNWLLTSESTILFDNFGLVRYGKVLRVQIQLIFFEISCSCVCVIGKLLSE
jgi:hypothetical protein